MAIPTPGNISTGDVEAGQIRADQTFNIAPSGLNLGEVLKPFQESFYNGGYGVRSPTPYAFTANRRDNPTPFSVAGVGGATLGFGAAFMVIIGLIIFFGLRR